MGQLGKRLADVAADAGADLVGVARVADFSRYRRRRHPSHYLDSAESVIVIGYHMSDPILDVWLDRMGGKRYFLLVNEILGNIALEVISELLKEGKSGVLTPYSGVYAKDAAVLAGLGVIGKNNLLLTEDFGPRVRLRTVVTDADLEPSPRLERDFCEGCDAHCQLACPADAFRGGRFSRQPCQDFGDAAAGRLTENSFLLCRECELACPIGLA